MCVKARLVLAAEPSARCLASQIVMAVRIWPWAVAPLGSNRLVLYSTCDADTDMYTYSTHVVSTARPTHRCQIQAWRTRCRGSASFAAALALCMYTVSFSTFVSYTRSMEPFDVIAFLQPFSTPMPHPLRLQLRFCDSPSAWLTPRYYYCSPHQRTTST